MNDTDRLLAKYPGYVPCIVKCDSTIEMTKKRFLLPKDQCWSYALSSIRRHVKIKPSEALFFMVGNKIVTCSQNIGEFYLDYVKTIESDKIMVIDIFKEKTFGGIGDDY